MTHDTAAQIASRRRMRALIIAYACEPARGSEPGAGWGLVQAVAEFADCTVLVGPEHTVAIERRLRATRDDRITVVQVDEPAWIRNWNQHRAAWFTRYLVWLRAAGRVALRLHREQPFDVAHHATYSAYWLPTPAARLGIPVVWGPVGGAVVTPFGLWPLLSWRGLLDELTDYLAVRFLSWLPGTRETWRRAEVCLVQNEATLACLPAATRRRASVLNHALFVEVAPVNRAGKGNEFLVVGALETRKGVALALRALAHVPDDVRLVVFGDGPQRRPLERLARRLRISARVDFRGQAPRAELLTTLASARAVVFTGLREEGGLALAEAMLSGIPVVVLGHGGAQTIAACARDPERVALIPPASVSVTAQRMGAAMAKFMDVTAPAGGPSLDQAWARRLLRDAFDRAISTAPVRSPGS